MTGNIGAIGIREWVVTQLLKAFFLAAIFFLAAMAFVSLTISSVDSPLKLLSPKTKFDVDISRPVPGGIMHVTEVSFSNDRYAMVYVEGYWEGNVPVQQYRIRATLGDTAEGPASGDLDWYLNVGKDANIPGKRFRLEFQCPPATAKNLFVRVYFEDEQNQFTVTDKVAFEIPNSALQTPKNLVASPLPVDSTLDGLTVSLVSLKTGLNFASESRAPVWKSRATFNLSENGKPTDRWKLWRMKVIPNAGLFLGANYAFGHTKNGVIEAPISGTLWKGDRPFQLKATFYQMKDIPESECYILKDIRIPVSGQKTEIQKSWHSENLEIDFDALYAPGSVLPKALGLEKIDGPVLVFRITGDPDSLVKATAVQINGQKRTMDEIRIAIEPAGPTYILIGGLPDVGTIGIDFAVLREKRTFSFVANPE